MNVQVRPRPPLSPARSSDPVILFVDDEPDILSALRKCFRHEAYVLYTALGPAEGLSWLERASVDLVICDDRMPGMTAADFLLEARKRSPGTCRAILTGHPSETLVRCGLEAGADAFLYKPCEEGRLRERIRSLLKSRDPRAAAQW